jgi:MFS family permease
MSNPIDVVADGQTTLTLNVLPDPTIKRYRWRVIFLCFLTFITASLDRHVFGLMIDPIKRDLHLSDTELGLLTGAAFVVFYLICGIPFGRLLDSKSRPKVLGIAMAVWSLGTTLTGFANSFMAIFATRAIVGAGEAAVSPATGSMVADAYAGRSLARPMTIISLGSVLGPGLALLFGGGVLSLLHGHTSVALPYGGTLHAWQVVFLVLGLPGLLLAPFMICLRDPPRTRLFKDSTGQVVRPSFKEVGRFLQTYPKLCVLVIGGFSFFQIVSTGVAAWAPALLDRVYGLPTSRTGLILGVGYVAVGILSLLTNARWMDQRLLAGDATAPIRLARTYAFCGCVPMTLLTVVHTLPLAATLLFFVLFFNTAVMAASVAWARVLPSQVRAQIISIHLIATNLLGGLLGPLVIGLVTDRVFGVPKKIGDSLSIVCLLALLSAGMSLAYAVKHYRDAAARIDLDTI